MPHVFEKSACSSLSPIQPTDDCSPTVRRVRQFVDDGKSCCRRDCLRRFWVSLRDDVHQFGEDVAACSREAKEAALLMNLREHLSTGPSPRIEGQRQRIHVTYSIAPFGCMCRQAYVLLWDGPVSKPGQMPPKFRKILDNNQIFLLAFFLFNHMLPSLSE